jgi:hypothetical protein
MNQAPTTIAANNVSRSIGPSIATTKQQSRSADPHAMGGAGGQVVAASE